MADDQIKDIVKIAVRDECDKLTLEYRAELVKMHVENEVLRQKNKNAWILVGLASAVVLGFFGMKLYTDFWHYPNIAKREVQEQAKTLIVDEGKRYLTAAVEAEIRANAKDYIDRNMIKEYSTSAFEDIANGKLGGITGYWNETDISQPDNGQKENLCIVQLGTVFLISYMNNEGRVGDPRDVGYIRYAMRSDDKNQIDIYYGKDGSTITVNKMTIKTDNDGNVILIDGNKKNKNGVEKSYKKIGKFEGFGKSK